MSVEGKIKKTGSEEDSYENILKKEERSSKMCEYCIFFPPEL